MKPRNIVIIGSGIAGLSAAKAARKQDSLAKITILSQESDPPFYRLRLCELIGKDTPYESFYIHPLSWYPENGISLLLSHPVLSISDESRIVYTNKEEFPFDSLILASGSTSFMPPFIGKDRPGIHTLWDIRNITPINEELKKCRHAVVIGGGLLGLETAYCIHQLNIPVTLVEGAPRLLPKQLDEEGSAVFTKRVENLGISVITGQSISEFRGDGHVEELVLADGKVLKADIVVVSVGVRPNTGICSGSGIFMDRYIPVNEKMQVKTLLNQSAADSTGTTGSVNTAETTNPPALMKISDHLFAAGDVASFQNQWSGQWSVAALQGQIAGTNAAGGNAAYQIENSPYILNTMGTRIVVSGDGILSEGERIEILRNTIPDTDSYLKLVFKDNILTGGILIGDYAPKFAALQSLIKNKTIKSAVLSADFFPQ